MRKSLTYTFILILLSGCISCQERADQQAENENIQPISNLFPLKIGNVNLEIKVAITSDEQKQGLMHIKSLPENQGMIFPYHMPRQMSFWMKNTNVPLDIAYITADGIIREIYPLYPRDLRNVSSNREDLRYALEVNQGWFKKNNIKTGERINLKMLGEALKARGF